VNFDDPTLILQRFIFVFLFYRFFLTYLVLCRILQINLKEFSDPHDADEAQYQLDGRDVDGSRIIVEFAKGVSSVFSFTILNVILCSY
jgi:hypothetical protein